MTFSSPELQMVLYGGFIAGFVVWLLLLATPRR